MPARSCPRALSEVASSLGFSLEPSPSDVVASPCAADDTEVLPDATKCPEPRVKDLFGDGGVYGFASNGPLCIVLSSFGGRSVLVFLSIVSRAIPTPVYYKLH